MKVKTTMAMLMLISVNAFAEYTGAIRLGTMFGTSNVRPVASLSGVVAYQEGNVALELDGILYNEWDELDDGLYSGETYIKPRASIGVNLVYRFVESSKHGVVPYLYAGMGAMDMATERLPYYSKDDEGKDIIVPAHNQDDVKPYVRAGAGWEINLDEISKDLSIDFTVGLTRTATLTVEDIEYTLETVNLTVGLKKVF
jgi:hypothetical protein